jgi:hypothetical protein
MVEDEEIEKAVSRILQRSERQDDLEKLVGTFVDVGILPQLENNNNQIFYGRRGTGKTHVLRVLGSRISGQANNAVIYIDARTLGRTAQFSDSGLPIGQRCLSLFRDVLGEVHNALLEHLIERQPGDADRALEALDALAAASTEPVRRVLPESVTKESSESVTSASAAAASAKVSTMGLSARFSGGQADTAVLKESVSSSFRVENQDKVIFPALHYHLSKVLDLTGTRLFILFDEWSSLPADVQPFLAEFLKRSILPVRHAVLKIASLEYRSRFNLLEGGSPLGFELGADIAVTQDLDDYYVYDRNPEQITDAYANMLFLHLSSELPAGYLTETYDVGDGSRLASSLFTERNTFNELARASEGVVRDLINIFTSAYFNARRRGRKNIDRRAILDAARQWFEQDKSRYLDEQLQRVLSRIVDEIIGSRRARSFLLPRELERHPIIQRLFDARVLHPMQRGYADKDNPGQRYNIYTLDYGTYVDLLGTSKQPDLELSETAEGGDFLVPFDDKRSIRRIVLDERVLSE